MRAERDDAATVMQVQVRDEQAQRRMNRLRMPEEMASDSGCGRTGSNSKEQAEVGARAGGSAFVDEATHETERHATGGVGKRALVSADALEH